LKPLYSGGLCDPVICTPATTARGTAPSRGEAWDHADVHHVHPAPGEPLDQAVAQPVAARAVVAADGHGAREPRSAISAA
jgi:hypothetical protein